MIHSPLEQFEVISLVPFCFGNFDFSFSNASLMMLLSVFIIAVFGQLLSIDGGYLVPTFCQIFFEFFFKLLVQMVGETIGSKGSHFLAFIFSLFVFILMNNLIGLIPYSFTITSHIVVTITLAFAIWFGKLILDFRYHGLKLLGMLLPSGIPFVLAPAFIIIEFISFIIPIISLSVRLFANMMSGHILLKVIFGFAWSMMLAGGLLFVAHFVPLGILFLLLGLETAVALIQAYVFTILTCLYLSDMISGGH